MALRSRIEAIVSAVVTVHPHEIPALVRSSSCFFFVCTPSLLLSSPLLSTPSLSRSDWEQFMCLQILSAYFVILPLRDDGAISLGLSNLPGLFVGSLLLTLVAAPISTLVFSLPNLSKSKVTPSPEGCSSSSCCLDFHILCCFRRLWSIFTDSLVYPLFYSLFSGMLPRPGILLLLLFQR